MLAYIARRILLSGFTMEIMSVVIFVVIQLPEGDFVDSLIREARQASGDYSENLEKRLREYYGLDHASHVQYWKWVSRIVTKLEFGHGFGHISPRGGYQDSYRRPEPIRETIRQPVQMTIFLTAFTISLTWTLGIPIGIYSAVRQHTIGDYLFTFVGFSGLAVPDFLLGLVLMYLFFAYFDMSVGGLFSGEYSEAP